MFLTAKTLNYGNKHLKLLDVRQTYVQNLHVQSEKIIAKPSSMPFFFTFLCLKNMFFSPHKTSDFFFPRWPFFIIFK